MELGFLEFDMKEFEALVPVVVEANAINNDMNRLYNLESRMELEQRVRSTVCKFHQARDKYNSQHHTNRPTMRVLKKGAQIVAGVLWGDLALYYQDVIECYGDADPFVRLLRKMDYTCFGVGKAAIISMLFVHPSHTKKGLGKLMIRKIVEEDFLKHGIEHYVVVVRNPVTKKLFAELGGKLVDSLEGEKNGHKFTIELLVTDVREMMKMRPRL